MSGNTVYIGDFVHFPALGSAEIFHDYVLAVNSLGFIAFFEYKHSMNANFLLTSVTSDDDKRVTIPKGSFMIPTFCDLHLHAPQYLYQGTGLDLPLMTWLFEYAYKAERRIDSDPALAKRVYDRLAERLIEHGTGAVLLFGTIKTESNLILAEAMERAGLRALVGKLSMDRSSLPDYTEHDCASSLAAAEDFVDQMNERNRAKEEHLRLVEPVLTPRFVPTCSNELLHGLGDIAQRTGARVQSHLAEAHDQVAWVRGERGMEDCDVFEQANLHTSKTVQAHCTYLTPSELNRLAAAGTSIAHCPLSNAYFSARPFPLREALTAGVRVGLGTDIAGGYSADIMSAMRWSVGVARMRDGARVEMMSGTDMQLDDSKRIDWKESLYLATKGGAEALGLKGGAFEVGAPFDAQLIRLYDPETLQGVGPLDWFDLDTSSKLDLEMVEKWWCLGDTRNRNGMWVQGQAVGSWATQ
ncbi:Metallo-dependent hydrolase [Peniophora sp. CONT]|nr:Metallo-dependent hydrolase [Peniophora sp. CONT]